MAAAQAPCLCKLHLQAPSTALRVSLLAARKVTTIGPKGSPYIIILEAASDSTPSHALCHGARGLLVLLCLASLARFASFRWVGAWGLLGLKLQLKNLGCADVATKTTMLECLPHYSGGTVFLQGSRCTSWLARSVIKPIFKHARGMMKI